MNEFFKICYYNSRKDNRCIFQDKGHHHVLERSPFYCEGGHMYVFFMDLYLVVAQESICKSVYFLSSHIIQNFIYKRYRKRVMHTCTIQLPRVYTNSDFSFIILVLYHHRTNTFTFFYWPNDSYCEHLFRLLSNHFFISRVQYV